jgi:hypothetical protein
MATILQQAVIAGHLEFHRVLGTSFIRSSKDLEEKMLSESNGMLRCLIHLHRECNGKASNITSSKVEAISNQYCGNFAAIKHCLCAVKQIYVAHCEDEDKLFLNRVGDNAVKLAEARKTKWMQSMVEQHKQMTESLKKRRTVVEETAQKLADKLSIEQAI